MKVKERIIITKEVVDSVETQILFNRHVERYCLARKYLFGDVIDVACGVGYGSYLCAKNPDVKTITGFDIDVNSIFHAEEHFSNDRIKYACLPLNDINGDFDVLLSLETIEHLQDPRALRDLAVRCGVKEVILSFPNKKTTHYNKYHLWDVSLDAIEKIFFDFFVLDSFDFYDSKYVHLAVGKTAKKYPEKAYKI